MTHTIIISPSLDSNQAPRHNAGGPLFDVRYHGQIIVTATTEPCLDGARALKALGCSGKLELWDDVTPYIRLTADIDKAAKQTVREGDRPPAFAKFKPFSQRLAKDGDLVAGATSAPPSPKMPPTDSSGRVAEIPAPSGFEPVGVVTARIVDGLMASRHKEAA